MGVETFSGLSYYVQPAWHDGELCFLTLRMLGLGRSEVRVNKVLPVYFYRDRFFSGLNLVEGKECLGSYWLRLYLQRGPRFSETPILQQVDM